MNVLIVRVFNRETGHVNAELAYGPESLPRIRELETEVAQHLQRFYFASRWRAPDVLGSNEAVYAFRDRPEGGPNDTVVGIRTVEFARTVVAQAAVRIPSALAIVDGLVQYAPYAFHDALIAPHVPSP